MTTEQIKELALKCGFKLKEQPNGEMDLNEYVYDFARKLLENHAKNYVINSLKHKKVNWSLNKGVSGYTINIDSRDRWSGYRLLGGKQYGGCSVIKEFTCNADSAVWEIINEAYTEE